MEVSIKCSLVVSMVCSGLRVAAIPGGSITVVRPPACGYKLPAEVGSVIVTVVPTTYDAFPLADSVQTA